MDYTPLIEKRRQRLEELETVIAEPDFFSDQKKASEIMREHRRLKELLETWDELNGTEQQLADNQELAKTDDPELAELAALEIPELEARLEKLRSDVQYSLLPRDTTEDRDAIIETLNFAFPTILTSGTIMTVSGILIGQMTSDACIVGIGQCLGRGTIISIILVLFVLPQILLIGTRIVDRTSFAVPKLVARSSGNGRMRVNGIVQGEIHGSVAGTMNAIVDGDVQLTVISGNVSQELDDNKQQEVQNEDQ